MKIWQEKDDRGAAKEMNCDCCGDCRNAPAMLRMKNLKKNRAGSCMGLPLCSVSAFTVSVAGLTTPDRYLGWCEVCAHFLHMQALFNAGGGTLLSVSSVNTTETHQHSSSGLPVSFAISMAHWLGSPHTGQDVGSI